MSPIFAIIMTSVVFSLSANAQSIVLYSTLKDFAAGKGKVIGEYQGYEWSKNGVLLLTPPEKGKKPVVHDVTASWGYSIGEYSYRLYKGLPHIILKQSDKGVYYENGLAHMDMTLEVRDRSDVEYGKYCFLSASIESPIVYVPSKDAKKLLEDNAAVQPFLTCIDKFKWTEAKKIRGCLTQLE